MATEDKKTEPAFCTSSLFVYSCSDLTPEEKAAHEKKVEEMMNEPDVFG